MNKVEVEAAIATRLEERKKSVLNRNAISALFGVFDDPVGVLGQIFVGRSGALDQEKQNIAQDIILDLLCRIDASMTQAIAASQQCGVALGGLIETIANGGEQVIGVDISSGSGSVTLQPGTHVRTVGIGVRSITGVKVGDDKQ